MRGFQRPVARDLRQGQDPVGAADAVRSIFVFDVLRRGFEYFRCRVEPRLDQFAAGDHQRAAADRHGAARASPHAPGRFVRVALDDADAVHLDAQPFGQHLGVDRFVRLAVRHGADQHDDLSVRRAFDVGPVGDSRTASFQKIAVAQPAIEAARLAVGAARGKSGDVREAFRLRHRGGEIAAVVGGQGGRAVGHRFAGTRFR